MTGDGGERRRHRRVPVAAKRITLRVLDADGSGTVIPAQLLDVSPAAMSVAAPLAGVTLGTRVGVHVEIPWWRFTRRFTAIGVVRRISEDGTRWAVHFAVEDEAARKRLESFVNRAYQAFDRLLQDEIGARLAESLRRVELGFGPRTSEGARVVLITSAVAGEGKASVAAGVSIVLAGTGRRVLLVDADADRLSIAGARTDGPVSPLILEPGERPLNALSIPVWRNVDLLSIGDCLDVSVMRLNSLMERFRAGGYDYVILNVPPLLNSAGASALTAAVDDVFVVARTGVSKERQLLQVRDLLARDNAPFRGIILTDEPDAVTPPRRRSRSLSPLASRWKKAAPAAGDLEAGAFGSDRHGSVAKKAARNVLNL